MKIRMELPNDVFMLYSFVNMKLRDSYKSLDEMCNDMNIDKKKALSKNSNRQTLNTTVKTINLYKQSNTKRRLAV